jgi:hypothetical protein
LQRAGSLAAKTIPRTQLLSLRLSVNLLDKIEILVSGTIVHPNGHDFPQLIDESVPCKAAVTEDISPWDLKTRIESKFSSTNCQMDALIVNYRFKFEWRDGDFP